MRISATKLSWLHNTRVAPSVNVHEITTAHGVNDPFFEEEIGSCITISLEIY